MADRAFDQLESQLALTFFRPGTPSYDQALRAAQRQARGDEPRGGLPSLPDLADLAGLGETY